ncbi:MAG: VWA domain-containing protein, partial [Polyangiaceae bacterium]|nr:VWA domain-containing protein [Polyangiaceae bacterium]
SPCAELLCTRAVMGVAPNETGAMAAFAQVGLSSTVDPATYVRPSLAVVATVDISGSMQWSYGDGQGTAPAAIAQTLLHNLARRLGGGDRFALVTYGSDVTTELDWTDGDDPEVLEAVGTLAEGGSTNMEAGLERAYELAEEALGSAEEVRVLLFTDAQPNVGATGSSAFESIVDAGAADGIGITVFGLGLGLGADLMGHMAVLRGANAFSLDHADDVALFVEDNWPWLAAPIAYDLHVALAPRADLSLHRTFGFPAAGPGATEAKVDAASVFLSKNRGALLAELLPAAPAELAGAEVGLTLSYVDRGGTPHSSELAASYAGQPLDERGAFMPQVGIDKTVALALLADGLRTAATEYGTDHAQAIATLEAALARFAIDAAHIGAADLDAEAAFWPALLQLMHNGAPQGDLYGQGSY